MHSHVRANAACHHNDTRPLLYANTEVRLSLEIGTAD